MNDQTRKLMEAARAALNFLLNPPVDCSEYFIAREKIRRILREALEGSEATQ